MTLYFLPERILVLDKRIYDSYLNVLKKELVPAFGCTEPIAIALAAAKARQVPGEAPSSLEIRCSGNIIKNVTGAVLPNSGGIKGVEIAAILGALGGEVSRGPEVLERITEERQVISC